VYEACTAVRGGHRRAPTTPCISAPEHLWPRQSGVIIEDYSALVGGTARPYGRRWALSGRRDDLVALGSVTVTVTVSVVVVVLPAERFRCQVQQVQLGDRTTLDVHGGSQQAGVVGMPQLVVPRFQLGVDRGLVQCSPVPRGCTPVCVKGSSLSDQPISISVPAKLSGR